MTYVDGRYDLLDIFRVLKQSWIYLVVISMLSAIVLGVWGYVGAQNSLLTNKVQAEIRFPSDALNVGTLETKILSVPALKEAGSELYSLSIEDRVDKLQPVYRTVVLALDTTPALDSQAILTMAIAQIGRAVADYDAETRRRLSETVTYGEALRMHLSKVEATASPNEAVAETIVRANAVAAIIDTMNGVDLRQQELLSAAAGPLETLQPPRSVSGTSLRWVRLAIVGALGGLIAGLCISFTLDGLRFAAEQRRRLQ